MGALHVVPLAISSGKRHDQPDPHSFGKAQGEVPTWSLHDNCIDDVHECIYDPLKPRSRCVWFDVAGAKKVSLEITVGS